jgi:hypothetical protein
MADGGTTDLGRRTVRGGVTVFAATLAAKVLGLAVLAILARLLTPEDYGLFGMFMMATRDAGTVAVFVSVAVLLLLLFCVAGSARLRDNLAALCQKMALAREARPLGGVRGHDISLALDLAVGIAA